MLKVSLLYRNHCWYCGLESRHPVWFSMIVLPHVGHIVRSNVDTAFCDLGGGGGGHRLATAVH